MIRRKFISPFVGCALTDAFGKRTLLATRPPTTILLASIIFVFSTGCVTTKQPAQPTPKARVVAVGNSSPSFNGNAITALDPCADQMQDICGALLSYYFVKKKLPAKLDELQQYADFGQTLKFTCPVSGKPYVYVPQGLEAPGQNLRIYVYDAAPVHNGARWCAVSKTGATTGADAIFAEKIPESRFSQFLSGAAVQPSAPAAPTQPKS